MNDFAAAAMMRLIGLGLEQQGLAMGGAKAPATAHVPLGEKRALADALLAAHGPEVLLRVGEAVEIAPAEPVMIALDLARDPFDLVSRWQRLERFIHSRHRVRIEGQGVRGLVLRHVALAPHPPPHPGEDLLVFGLLIALIRRSGAADLRARLQGDRIWCLRREKWSKLSRSKDFSCWELDWTGVGVAARHDQRHDIDGDWVKAGRHAIAADPGRGWTLALLAEELRISRRSLQRRLGEGGATFSSLLAVTRLNAASQRLGTSQSSLAEVGYACGFSDQAHFAREFKRHIGTTPSSFRTQFALASS